MDYCTFGNLECAISCVCGGAVGGYGETFAPFAVVELGEVVLHGWKPRLLSFEGTKSAFREIWELERLFCVRRNLGFYAFVELRGGFCVRGNLGLLAH